MTQPHPQQEYIITEDQLSVLTDPHRGYSEYRSELKKIRSRIYPSAAPAERLCDDCNIIELEERLINLEQELKDARKAEREHVLDELILMIKRKEGCGYIFMDGPRFFTMIESLRGGGAP